MFQDVRSTVLEKKNFFFLHQQHYFKVPQNIREPQCVCVKECLQVFVKIKDPLII